MCMSARWEHTFVWKCWTKKGSKLKILSISFFCSSPNPDTICSLFQLPIASIPGKNTKKFKKIFTKASKKIFQSFEGFLLVTFGYNWKCLSLWLSYWWNFIIMMNCHHCNRFLSEWWNFNTSMKLWYYDFWQYIFFI